MKLCFERRVTRPIGEVQPWCGERPLAWQLPELAPAAIALRPGRGCNTKQHQSNGECLHWCLAANVSPICGTEKCVDVDFLSISPRKRVEGPNWECYDSLNSRRACSRSLVFCT